MAGGMLTKQADQLTARFLNDVNDASLGGQIVSLPTGITGPQVSATNIGDRIVLDDATALALSDTTIGTLFGGVYMYVKSTVVTRAVVRGGIAFNKLADIGAASNTGYNVYSDADPSTSVPTHIAGIYINVITSGNYGWIQVAGAASILFDSTALTSVADGNWVTAKVSAATASTADVGAAAGVVTLAALLGVAYGLPTSNTVSTVMLTRGNFCGRI